MKAMKFEEAMLAFNELIPQESGYFVLRAEQYWHDEGEIRRRQSPNPPSVEISIERGPREGNWQQFEAPTLAILFSKVKAAYESQPAEVPTAIEEAEVQAVVEPGEGFAQSLEPNESETDRIARRMQEEGITGEDLAESLESPF